MYVLLSAKRRAYFCKGIAIEMGVVSRYVSKVSGSGVAAICWVFSVWAFCCHTVGTKIIADPEKCFQELLSDTLLFLLRDRPCLECFLFPVILRVALLAGQITGIRLKAIDFSKKGLSNYWTRPFQNSFSNCFGADSMWALHEFSQLHENHIKADLTNHCKDDLASSKRSII